MAIDRNQINQIRNNGVYRIANGPFDTKVIGYTKNPGFPQVQPEEGEEARQRRTRPRTAASSASCSSTPTTPPTRRRPSSSRSSSPRRASTPRSSRTTRPRSSSPRSRATSASCCGANTPVTTPTCSTSGGTRARSLNFGKFTDPTLQGLIDQGRTETDPAKRKQIYTDVNKRFASQVYNVWAYYADWVVGREEERAGPGRPAAPRRWRQAAVLLYGRQPLLGLYLTK